MVNPARFERATSTSAESRSDSAELRVLGLAETEGVEPSQDYTRLFSKQLRLPFRHVSRKSFWRRVRDSNSQAHPCAAVFRTAPLPVRGNPPNRLAGAAGFEPARTG